MVEKKYGYTGRTIKYLDRVFSQIIALRNISSTVHKGDVGGFVERGDILCHTGRSWIDADCVVGGNVIVCGNSTLINSFVILQEDQHLRIDGCSRVTNTEFGCDNAVIIDSVVKNSTIDGTCIIMGSEVLRSDLKNVAITESNIIECDLSDRFIIDSLYVNDIKR